MRTVECPHCSGTGLIQEWEVWESALLRLDAVVEYIERKTDGTHFVSLDVEGSYPEAVIVEHTSDIEAVELELRHWPMRGRDVLTSPRNNDGGVYAPVDPRFYETTSEKE